ncbi:hypothetical protein B0H14DRAFT_2575392 [Mycena olivaceomarginata]|nr:hypothetical protein B0H14DRAFT_2575392 [Mycena olivaceomarginata]
MYQLTSNSAPTVSEEMKAVIEELPTWSPESQMEYDEFFETHGSHVVIRVALGGLLRVVLRRTDAESSKEDTRCLQAVEIFRDDIGGDWQPAGHILDSSFYRKWDQHGTSSTWRPVFGIRLCDATSAPDPPSTEQARPRGRPKGSKNKQAMACVSSSQGPPAKKSRTSASSTAGERAGSGARGTFSSLARGLLRPLRHSPSPTNPFPGTSTLSTPANASQSARSRRGNVAYLQRAYHQTSSQMLPERS